MNRIKKRQFRQRKARVVPPGWVRFVERGMLLAVLSAAGAGMVPRAVRAGAENRVSILVDRLQQVRSGIAVYRAEHHGRLPAADLKQADGRAFAEALTSPDEQGRGPYLSGIPVNPFAEGEGADEVTVVYDPAALPGGQETTGWWYNAATGHFAACDSQYHAAF